MFVLCPHFDFLWPLMRAWIGFDGVDIQVIHDHLNQSIYYTGGLKARRNFLHLIWLLCSWILWNERNNRLFNNQECNSYQLLEKVKYYSLWWPKAKQFTFVFGTQTWCSNPQCVWVSTSSILLFLIRLFVFLVVSLTCLMSKDNYGFVNIIHFSLLKKTFYSYSCTRSDHCYNL